MRAVAGTPGPGAHVRGVEGAEGGGAGSADPDLGGTGAGAAVQWWMCWNVIEAIIMMFGAGF